MFVAVHLLGLVGRGDECAGELPGMVAAQLDGFRVAVDDHGCGGGRDVAGWPLRAVNLNDDVVVLVVPFDNPR